MPKPAQQSHNIQAPQEAPMSSDGRVLSETRHVHVEVLPHWVPGVCSAFLCWRMVLTDHLTALSQLPVITQWPPGGFSPTS